MLEFGKETGSLVNHFHSLGKVEPDVIEVGMPATLLRWSDRTPATVVAKFVKGKNTYICIQEDDYKRIDNHGESESQSYEYVRNENNIVRIFKIKDGKAVAVRLSKKSNRYVLSDKTGVIFGVRERYYDFSF